jgi:hypothetical protein
MKKVFIIGLIAAGFAFASASRSDAGVSVGIGIGIPVGYPYGYYSQGCYPYAYYPYRPYYRTVVFNGPRRYWHRGHRAYYSRPYYRHY